MKIFHLTFNREADGDWYIEFPGYPFAHHNLMMVAGADQMCAYVARMEGHPDKAVVDVTLDGKRIAGKIPVITMERFEKGYGAKYRSDSFCFGMIRRFERFDCYLGNTLQEGRPQGLVGFWNTVS